MSKPVTTYVISDLHFGHGRIAEFRSEFASMEEHEEEIMRRWRDTVHPRDRVWVLGDAAFNREGLDHIAVLPGTKYLVRGNHDTLSTADYLQVFKEIYGIVKYKRKGRLRAWLSHAPVHPDELRGCLNIHGHVHNQSIQYGDGDDPRYINACPEAIGYAPINLHELLPKKEDPS